MSVSRKNSGLIVNAILLLGAFFLQYNGVFKISVFGVSPCLPLCIVIAVSIFISEISAFFLGLTVGIIADAFTSTSFGFNSIIISVICLFVSLISHYLFNQNVRANIVLQLVFTVIYYVIRWLVFLSNVTASESLRHFISSILPSAVFTAIISILIYYIEKKFYKNVG